MNDLRWMELLGWWSCFMTVVINFGVAWSLEHFLSRNDQFGTILEAEPYGLYSLGEKYQRNKGLFKSNHANFFACAILKSVWRKTLKFHFECPIYKHDYQDLVSDGTLFYIKI